MVDNKQCDCLELTYNCAKTLTYAFLYKMIVTGVWTILKVSTYVFFEYFDIFIFI